MVEQLDGELAALVERGFPVARAIAAVSHYTTGFVLQEQASRTGAPPAPERIPTLVAARAEPGDPFDGGLALVIGGIAVELDPDAGSTFEP